MLLRIRGVQELVPFGKSKIYDLVSKRRFPAPVKIEGGAFWERAKVEAWVAEHLASRPSGPGR